MEQKFSRELFQRCLYLDDEGVLRWKVNRGLIRAGTIAGTKMRKNGTDYHYIRLHGHQFNIETLRHLFLTGKWKHGSRITKAHRPHSQATRQRMSIAHLGKTVADATKAKMSTAHTIKMPENFSVHLGLSSRDLASVFSVSLTTIYKWKRAVKQLDTSHDIEATIHWDEQL